MSENKLLLTFSSSDPSQTTPLKSDKDPHKSPQLPVKNSQP